jgi:hypothetical protein
VLAIPILDTTLVTIARLVEKRPGALRAGETTRRTGLVYYGLSETKAVLRSRSSPRPSVPPRSRTTSSTTAG